MLTIVFQGTCVLSAYAGQHIKVDGWQEFSICWYANAGDTELQKYFAPPTEYNQSPKNIPIHFPIFWFQSLFVG